MTIDFELHQQAYELAVLEGLTLDQVAERTGIPRRTIAQWSSSEGWVADREEYRRAQGEIRRDLVLYRMKLLKQGMRSLDPQHAYAWATVESAARKGMAGGVEADKGEPVMEREIRTAQDAVEALQEAVEIKINRMLTNPGELKFSAIKDMRSALSMVEELKRTYDTAGEEEARKSLNKEEALFWREKILGVK